MKKKISIAFTQKQWSEIFYAVDSKILMIKNGHLGPQLKRGDDARWVNELADIADDIETKVEV